MYLHNPVTDKEKITPCHPSLLLPPIEAVQTTARNLFARLFNSDLAESHTVSSERNIFLFLSSLHGGDVGASGAVCAFAGTPHRWHYVNNITRREMPAYPTIRFLTSSPIAFAIDADGLVVDG